MRFIGKSVIEIIVNQEYSGVFEKRLENWNERDTISEIDTGRGIIYKLLYINQGYDKPVKVSKLACRSVSAGSLLYQTTSKEGRETRRKAVFLFVGH